MRLMPKLSFHQFCKKMQPKHNINANFLKVLCGSSLVTIGVLMIVHCTSFFNYVLNIAYSMHPGSFAFNTWRKYPMPLSINGYFWNWTNPHEIYNHSIKPKFVQIGPYVYHEDKEKVNITWNDNNTLSFRQRHVWQFDREASVGDQTDLFTTLNPVAFVAAHKMRHWSYFMKKGFSLSMAALVPKIHITKSIGETMFEGYEDPLMKMAKSLPFLIEDELDFELQGKFGWFQPRNGSERFDGLFNIGIGGEHSLGEMLTWNYKKTLPIHEGKCSQVYGSSGEFFPPMEDVNHITTFSPEICQPISLDLEGYEEKFGIMGKSFVVGDSFLDNGTKIEGNKCFCDGECVPYGAVNASACRYGTPAFVSLPHFLHADPSYREAVEGMEPDKEKHQFRLLFEPKTRIPLRAEARLQLSILLHPVKHIRLYENVPRMFFPVLWFEQIVELPVNYRLMVQILLSLPTTMTVVGAINILIGLAIVFRVLTLGISNRYSKIHTNQIQLSQLEKNAFVSTDELDIADLGIVVNKDKYLRRETFSDIMMFDQTEKEPFIGNKSESVAV